MNIRKSSPLLGYRLSPPLKLSHSLSNHQLSDTRLLASYLGRALKLSFGVWILLDCTIVQPGLFRIYRNTKMQNIYLCKSFKACEIVGMLLLVKVAAEKKIFCKEIRLANTIQKVPTVFIQ